MEPSGIITFTGVKQPYRTDQLEEQVSHTHLIQGYIIPDHTPEAVYYSGEGHCTRCVAVAVLLLGACASEVKYCRPFIEIDRDSERDRCAVIHIVHSPEHTGTGLSLEHDHYTRVYRVIE